MYEIKIISLVIRKIVYTYYTCIFMKKGDIIELKLFCHYFNYDQYFWGLWHLKYFCSI